MSKRKNPNSNKKSGSAGFIITLLLLSWVTGFSFPGILAGIFVGLGIGKITSIMGSGLDTTTHNTQDEERRRKEEEERRAAEEQHARARALEIEKKKREEASRIPLTGDATADAVITKGQEMVDTIRRENAAIPDETLTEQMNSVCEKCEQIFRTVSESPAKAPQVRKFMNYYLPTTLKILANYRTMEQRGVSYQDLQQARETTIRGMNMILTACQKQIDNLHKENMLDISTDIDVLEQMLKRDGYTENEITGNKGLTFGARTAAEAQRRSSSAPVMEFPEEDDSSVSGSEHSAYRAN